MEKVTRFLVGYSIYLFMVPLKVWLLFTPETEITTNGSTIKSNRRKIKQMKKELEEWKTLQNHILKR